MVAINVFYCNWSACRNNDDNTFRVSELYGKTDIDFATGRQVEYVYDLVSDYSESEEEELDGVKLEGCFASVELTPRSQKSGSLKNPTLPSRQSTLDLITERTNYNVKQLTECFKENYTCYLTDGQKQICQPQKVRMTQHKHHGEEKFGIKVDRALKPILTAEDNDIEEFGNMMREFNQFALNETGADLIKTMDGNVNNSEEEEEQDQTVLSILMRFLKSLG